MKKIFSIMVAIAMVAGLRELDGAMPNAEGADKIQAFEPSSEWNHKKLVAIKLARINSTVGGACDEVNKISASIQAKYPDLVREIVAKDSQESIFFKFLEQFPYLKQILSKTIFTFHMYLKDSTDDNYYVRDIDGVKHGLECALRKANTKIQKLETNLKDAEKQSNINAAQAQSDLAAVKKELAVAQAQVLAIQKKLSAWMETTHRNREAIEAERKRAVVVREERERLKISLAELQAELTQTTATSAEQEKAALAAASKLALQLKDTSDEVERVRVAASAANTAAAKARADLETAQQQAADAEKRAELATTAQQQAEGQIRIALQEAVCAKKTRNAALGAAGCLVVAALVKQMEICAVQ